MKATLAMGTLAFVVLGCATSACAHNADQVRRELSEQGYDQIEFTVAKPPFKVNACRGGERFHLHVDYYGKAKVTKETPIGSCDGNVSRAPAAASPGVAAPEQESIEKPDCKRYVPAVGMTVSVPCPER